MNFDFELREASRIALGCADVLMQHYSPKVEFCRKKDGSVVTIADKLSNVHALRELQRVFPLDSIVSEEENEMVRGSNDRCWYIDPLDGTSGYVGYTDEFAVHVGLAQDGIPVLGVVYKPVGKKMFFGAQGVGSYMISEGKTFDIKQATLNGRILACHSRLPISDIGKKLIAGLGITDLEITGSEGLRIMRLATGRAHLYVGNVSLKASSWDVCAPDAICRAAGASMKYIDGSEVVYNRQGKMDTKYVISFDEQLRIDTQQMVNSLELEKVGKPWV